MSISIYLSLSASCMRRECDWASQAPVFSATIHRLYLSVDYELEINTSPLSYFCQVFSHKDEKCHQSNCCSQLSAQDLVLVNQH